MSDEDWLADDEPESEAAKPDVTRLSDYNPAAREQAGDDESDWFADDEPPAVVDAPADEADVAHLDADDGDLDTKWLSASDSSNRAAPQAQPFLRRHWKPLVAGVSVVTLAGTVVAVSVAAIVPDDSSSADLTAITTVAAPPLDTAKTAAKDICDDAGSRDSVTGTVAAFQWAYYHDRSSESVNALFAPGKGLDPAVLDPALIDLPADAGYCLSVEATSSSTVTSRTTQTGSAPVTFKPQIFTLQRSAAGTWEITALAEADD